MKINHYEWVLIAAFVVALYKIWRGYKLLPLFPLFLSICVLFELFITHYWMSWTFIDAQYRKSNFLPYNIYATITVVYYLFVFFHNIDKKYATYLKVVIGMWAIFAVYSLSLNGWFQVTYPSYIIGLTITLGLVINFLYRLAYIDEYTDLKFNPRIYLAFAILIFFFTGFPTLFFINKFIVEVNSSGVYTTLLKISNLILVFGYLAATICTKEKNL